MQTKDRPFNQSINIDDILQLREEEFNQLQCSLEQIFDHEHQGNFNDFLRDYDQQIDFTSNPLYGNIVEHLEQMQVGEHENINDNNDTKKLESQLDVYHHQEQISYSQEMMSSLQSSSTQTPQQTTNESSVNHFNSSENLIKYVQQSIATDNIPQSIDLAIVVSSPVNHSKPIVKNKDALLKQDYGFKILLRKFRKILQTKFYATLTKNQQYKWNKDISIWETKVKIFLNDQLEILDISQQEVWASMLLIYPQFGPQLMGKQYAKASNDNIKRLEYEGNFHFQKLNHHGILVYRDIFNYNRKPMVYQFFKDPFIRKIWPKIMSDFEEISREQNLKTWTTSKCQYNLHQTFCQMSTMFKYEFQLPLPKWWFERFPAKQQKMNQGN